MTMSSDLTADAHLQIADVTCWQVCPVCLGTGLVSRPPNVPGDQQSWSATSAATYPCKICKSTGVLAVSSTQMQMSRYGLP